MFTASELSNVDVILKRADKTYRQNEIVSGLLRVTAKEAWDYKSIVLTAEGCVHVADVGEGLFGDTGKPIELLRETIRVASGGRFPYGITDVPFEFPVRGIAGGPLHESYSGVYITIAYKIIVEIERGFVRKAVRAETDFVVEVPTETRPPEVAVPFEVTPESLENVRQGSRKRLPGFLVSGRLHRASWPVNAPLTGEVVVEHADGQVRSIEAQLIRVETVRAPGSSGGELREATEIQNLQIGDGDVCRGLMVPVYMVFPRLFSSPTMVTQRFSVEFEVNLMVVFEDGHVVTENLPIVLYRPSPGS